MKTTILMLLMAFFTFSTNQVIAQETTFEENFNGVVDTLLWDELGGENGIIPTVQDGGLKYTCTANGSFWFQSLIRFHALTPPVVFYLKDYPYVSFKAMAEPGATYDGIELDSVNVAFTDNYGEYLSYKIPADGKYYELIFYISETEKDGYVGHDQMWINPGLTVADGHFEHEFIGTVWIDDFKVGEAATPALVSEVAEAKLLIAAATIGAGDDEYSQATIDAINDVIAAADLIIASKDYVEMDYAVIDFRNIMETHFITNSQYPVIVTSFEEDYRGIIKSGLWTTLGGENGIIPTLEEGALKYTCTANGSYWMRALYGFDTPPYAIVLDLKDHPFIRFNAKAEPGPTYDGIPLDSVTIGSDCNGEYFSEKIPADGKWHEIVMYLTLAADGNYGQLWFNPGLGVEDGHFEHEFVGTVWFDDFKIGEAAEHSIVSEIEEAKLKVASVTIGAGSDEYSQANVDAINAIIAEAELIAEAYDEASMDDALIDLQYYMSIFLPNSTYPILTTFEESFSGIVKEEIWSELGGDNGIITTFEEDALKYTCTSNGSFWFQSLLRFHAQPLPIVFFLKEHPYVGFKAMAEPGPTYDGYDLDSVNVAFTDNYGEYLSEKIPADGTWHELVFYLTETEKESYVGHDQMWVNTGLTVVDGHFSHEFIGTVWLDDFKVGSAIILPDTLKLAALIDSSKLAIEAVTIGFTNGDYYQEIVDAANVAIATAEVQLDALTQGKIDNAENSLREAMALFIPISISIEELQTVIDSSKTVVADAVIGDAEGNYTQESIDAANAAIALAETQLAAETQALVDQAVLDLRDEMALFVPISVSRIELQAVIDSSKTVVADAVIGVANGEYTQESVDAANAAIAAAEAQLEAVTQAAVDQAVQDLRDAMALFVPLANVSVNQLDDDQFGLYPNPAGNTLIINNVIKYNSAGIYSLKGQLILKIQLNKENNVKIDLSNIKEGVYMINLTSDEGVVTRQFIKK